MLVIAHRGASFTAPENTLAAFRAAKKPGIDGFETDVQLTRDQKLVIHHNYTVDARSDGRGRVCDLTLEELNRLDFGVWKGPAFAGERIPTLARCLEAARDFSIVNLELKAPVDRTVPFVAPVVRAIRDAGLAEKVRLSSFDHGLLREAKALLPDLRVGVLTSRAVTHRVSVQLLARYAPRDKALGALVPGDLRLPQEDGEIRKLLNKPDREPGEVLLERAKNLSVLYPGAAIGEVMDRLEEQLDLESYLAGLDFPADYLHCEYHACLDDPGLAERLARRGIGVTPWTPDDPEDLRRLAAQPLDGIITNRPDLLLDILGEGAP